jgi:hypothetical protein
MFDVFQTLALVFGLIVGSRGGKGTARVKVTRLVPYNMRRNKNMSGGTCLEYAAALLSLSIRKYISRVEVPYRAAHYRHCAQNRLRIGKGTTRKEIKL